MAQSVPRLTVINCAHLLVTPIRIVMERLRSYHHAHRLGYFEISNIAIIIITIITSISNSHSNSKSTRNERSSCREVASLTLVQKIVNSLGCF